MEISVRNALLAVLLFAFCGIANAETYGPYVCRDCLVLGPTPEPDTRNFISDIVNRDVDQWRPNDKVVICNLSTCVTYAFRGTGFIEIARRPRATSGSAGGGEPGGSASTGSSGGIPRPVYVRTSVCAGGTCWIRHVIVEWIHV